MLTFWKKTFDNSTIR